MSTHLSFTTPLGKQIIVPMRQMRKPRHREQKQPAQGHAAGKWQGWIPNGALWWGCEMVQPLWETVWWCLENLNVELPCDPEVPLLGTYPGGLEVGVQVNICMRILSSTAHDSQKEEASPPPPAPRPPG